MNGWRHALVILLLLSAYPRAGICALIPENERLRPTVTIHVSPKGDDSGDGSQARPFRSLTRAQQAVRGTNQTADVVVMLAAGWYRLEEPLRFAAADGGQAGTKVSWPA